MPQILGEYECSVDSKGRLRIPTPLARQLGEDNARMFVINRGLDKNLVLYPKEVWDSEKAKIDQLNPYNEEDRLFIRYFYRGATELETDEQGRVLLPKRLMEYAGIDKDTILSAVGDRIEVWSADEFDRMNNDDSDVDFSKLAAKVLGKRSKDAEQ